MIPIRNSLPYDLVMNDVYAQECPFCERSNVLLPLRPEEVENIRGGRKKVMLVFPCCHGSLKIVDADSDYLLANRPIRGKP